VLTLSPLLKNSLGICASSASLQDILQKCALFSSSVSFMHDSMCNFPNPWSSNEIDGQVQMSPHEITEDIIYRQRNQMDPNNKQKERFSYEGCVKFDNIDSHSPMRGHMGHPEASQGDLENQPVL
jgi:hypothetical protein